MKYNEIFDKVADMLLDQLNLNREDIKPESRLVEDLGADSANVLILVCDMENEFGIEVENDVLTSIQTVDDVVKYLEKNVK